MTQKTVRLIISSTENGDQETVFFTEDFNSPAEEFIPPGQTVDFDQSISAELPDYFPMDYELKRS